MTDRYNSLTVILDKDKRSDDCECLINAIKQLRGVLEVIPKISTGDSWMAEARALQHYREKLIKVLLPDTGEK